MLRARFRREEPETEEGSWRLHWPFARGGHRRARCPRALRARAGGPLLPPPRLRGAPRGALEPGHLWSEDDPEPPSNERAIRKFVRPPRSWGSGPRSSAPDETGASPSTTPSSCARPRGWTIVPTGWRAGPSGKGSWWWTTRSPSSAARTRSTRPRSSSAIASPLPAPWWCTGGTWTASRPEVGLPLRAQASRRRLLPGRGEGPGCEALSRILPGLFAESELLVAQAWTPSSFDWRIGVLGR
jgi:hypothetical protein